MVFTDHEMRIAVVDACCNILHLSDSQAQDLEIGIFNWALQHADEHKIAKSYTDDSFRSLYHAKARSVMSNLDETSYIGNTQLRGRVLSGEVTPHDIPFMKPCDLFPERWKEIIDLKEQRDQYAATVRPVAMTSQYRCGRCKNTACIYQEIQLRSADEPASIIVTCLTCDNTWRLG